MDWLGITHLVAALLSMMSGLFVVLMRKGTRRHMQIGWLYVAAIGAVNVSALMIYDLFGRFGPFHIAAIANGVTVTAGLIPAIRRQPKRQWIGYHAYWMTWSYVGLLAAAVSEVATRYVRIRFGLVVVAATFVVILTGGLLIRVRVPRILKAHGIGIEAGVSRLSKSPESRRPSGASF